MSLPIDSLFLPAYLSILTLGLSRSRVRCAGPLHSSRATHFESHIGRYRELQHSWSDISAFGLFEFESSRIIQDTSSIHAYTRNHVDASVHWTNRAKKCSIAQVSQHVDDALVPFSEAGNIPLDSVLLIFLSID